MSALARLDWEMNDSCKKAYWHEIPPKKLTWAFASVWSWWRTHWQGYDSLLWMSLLASFSYVNSCLQGRFDEASRDTAVRVFLVGRRQWGEARRVSFSMREPSVSLFCTSYIPYSCSFTCASLFFFPHFLFPIHLLIFSPLSTLAYSLQQSIEAKRWLPLSFIQSRGTLRNGIAALILKASSRKIDRTQLDAKWQWYIVTSHRVVAVHKCVNTTEKAFH